MNNIAGLGSNNVSHGSHDEDERDLYIVEGVVLRKGLQHRTDRGLEEAEDDEEVHCSAAA